MLSALYAIALPSARPSVTWVDQTTRSPAVDRIAYRTASQQTI